MSRTSDRRGNSTDRRHRKTWLLRTFGNGVWCRCVHCGRALTRATLQADRIVPGGSYDHSNIQPSCGRCNQRRGDNPNPRPFEIGAIHA